MREMGEGFKSGWMEALTKACGITIRQMAKEDSYTQTEMFMLVTGLMTKRMVMESIHI